MCVVQMSAVVALAALALATVATPPFICEVQQTMLICGREFFILEHYPKDSPRRLDYNKKMIEHLNSKLIGVLRDLCKANAKAINGLARVGRHYEEWPGNDLGGTIPFHTNATYH